ncbi:MAG: RagB/SusD family nutrient uptake outer membrane protein [Fodinibius sp.]|nr:RagB/SusD family nutrient uptake outer membrane protein [Fodinibius sp.]
MDIQSYGDNNGDGTLEQGGAKHHRLIKMGLYEYTVDLNDMTYSMEQVDSRNTFYTAGQDKAIPELAEFTNGYAISKPERILLPQVRLALILTFVDIDFPMFRLADVYLMYAEATLRGSSGDTRKAVNLVNDLRERAFGNSSMRYQLF